MNKRVIALSALVVVTLAAYSQALSQSRCTLTEANSPSVRGLKLGMSTQELMAVFPRSATRWAKDPRDIRDARDKAMAPSSSEPVSITFEPATDAAKDQFTGVDSVAVSLYKGRVMDFTLVYVGAEWNNIDEWLAKVADTLKLPGSPQWVVGPSETPNKVLRCSGIEIEAAIQGGGSTIRIRNTDYLKGVEEQANTAKEKRRRDFKP